MLSTSVERGSNWTLEDLKDVGCREELPEALTFRNHKGATSKPEVLRNLVQIDVKNAYGLVIPIKSLVDIPGALVAPMNIMCQNTIEENGNIIPKDRLTHDLSFKW